MTHHASTAGPAIGMTGVWTNKESLVLQTFNQPLAELQP